MTRQTTEAERRAHVIAAQADARLEGIPSCPIMDEICQEYIRGEIRAEDLVEVYKERSSFDARRRRPSKIE